MSATSSESAEISRADAILTVESCSLPEKNGSHRIDSNLFQAGAGSTPILNYGSYAKGLYQVPLTLPPKALNGEIQHIALNESNDALEAAYQFQWTVEGKQWCTTLPSPTPQSR